MKIQVLDKLAYVSLDGINAIALQPNSVHDLPDNLAMSMVKGNQARLAQVEQEKPPIVAQAQPTIEAPRQPDFERQAETVARPATARMNKRKF